MGVFGINVSTMTGILMIAYGLHKYNEVIYPPVKAFIQILKFG